MAVLSTQPLFALWRDWWDEPRPLKNSNSAYKKPSIPSVEPPILVLKGLCFAMQWPSKGQSANSFARQICFKTESSRSNYLPVEYFGLQKVPNKDSQYNINQNINEPKQMGQNFRAKFCIFINLFNFTHWAPFWISSKRNVTSHW